MWIVRLALRRPYTFIVMSLAIVIVGALSIARMPTDIFPEIDIPVISVIFNYGGLPPDQMEKRIVNGYERFLTTVVNGIDHTESQTLTGIAIVKVYLQPGTSVDGAVAQIAAMSQTATRQMPPGADPPLIIRYSATNVPIMQVALQSDTLSEQELFDYGINFVRADIATIQGAQIPYPYGGKRRQIMVDINPQRLYGLGLSPRDVQAALGLQNIVLPSGSAKMGANEYPIVLNASPEALAQLGDLPIKTVRGTTVFVRDVASVRDGFAPQTNIVHVGPSRSVLFSVLKLSEASTLDVARRIKEKLPATLARLPPGLKVTTLFDQSVFVRAAVSGVVKEALVAALLTALMIFLFLGSWRSTLIVVISIPLSILVAIIVLYALGQTLNVMTLGGLALAVGILVDDATVAIENIHLHIARRKPLVRAILDGAQQIAVPAFVSTLCICIVFVPVASLTGAAKSLFVPLAMAVVFAMLTSYLLSRTLLPTMAHLMLAKDREHKGAVHRLFERLRQGYGGWLAWALEQRALVGATFAVFAAASMLLVPLVGRDFFPSVDAGLIKLHVRGAPGTRLEESEKRFAAIEDTVRKVVPAGQIQTLIDNIGVPYSGINLSLSEGVQISSADGQILIALKPGHPPTPEIVRALRKELHAKHPGTTFFFLAPDISSQVLNFGLATPIDVQVIGPVGQEPQTLAVAQDLAARIAKIPGAVDVHLAQIPSVPELTLDVDRAMASQAGLTERDVASDVLVSLSSSGQTSPGYWMDKRGIQYLVAVQTPQYAVNDLAALKATPLATPTGPQLLSNVAQVGRTTGPGNITHYNVSRTYDVQANIDGTDLGSVTSAVHRLLDAGKDKLPRGTTITVKGQAESMESSFRGLGYGLLFAILLVYLLMVVNFQSWLDPLVILMALPGALAGIVWMLYLTRTTLSVPALMGSIMCVGVATANSILVVTFANDQRKLGRNARDAALAAGMTRLRPVLMTALAMIIGMLPMALGLGEGGEQNAPLGRAVIGGLVLATFTTLFFVPLMYTVLRRRPPRAVDPELEKA